MDKDLEEFIKDLDELHKKWSPRVMNNFALGWPLSVIATLESIMTTGNQTFMERLVEVVGYVNMNHLDWLTKQEK